MEEIWKDVVGYEGDYMVSSYGRVKTIKFGRNKILGVGASVTRSIQFLQRYFKREKEL